MTEMSTGEAALDHAARYVDGGGFAAELARLVACPTDGGTPGAMEAYLQHEIGPLLASLGFACEILANPVPGGGPVLLAERIEGAGLPTVLSYGHADVVPGQAGQWRAGLAPFRLCEEGPRLYGRGTADNKGQHLINIRAMAALIATTGRLGFNATLIIETGEETGSPGLRAFCTQHAERLAADVFIASDGPRLREDRPTIFTGSRGAVAFDIAVELRDSARHSGNFGGLIRDPAIRLAHALASVTDAQGRILVPEWRPDSLTPRLREVLGRLPEPDVGLPVDPDWGEPGQSPAERVFGWNSFAVLAMLSGTPEAPVNAIAPWARARCQLRYVVGTDPEDVVPALRRHLDRAGLADVAVTEVPEGRFAATRLDPDHPWVAFAAASVARHAGVAPDLLPNLGGSLPNDCFADILGLPTLWLPHAHAGCCQHGPDEHLLKPVARQGLLAMTGLFADIAAGTVPGRGA